jgi:hypothetical protein
VGEIDFSFVISQISITFTKKQTQCLITIFTKTQLQ